MTEGQNDRILLTSLYRTQWMEVPSSVEPLRGDGSNRRLYRLRGTSGSFIGVVGDNLAENRAFVGFSESFRSIGLPVPLIHLVSEDGRAYLEEDLGDVTLYDRIVRDGAPCTLDSDLGRLYGEAVEALVRFQRDGHRVVPYALCYQTPEFDAEAMRADVRYFLDMFLLGFAEQQIDLDAFWGDADVLIARCDQVDRDAFLYRDFQSRNIMVTDDGLRFIDYQSGRRGARAYDLASLVMDAKAGLDWSMKDALMEHYMDASGLSSASDRARFLEEMVPFAILRLLQALGAFGNLGGRQGKPGFVSSIPPALETLATLAERAPLLRDLDCLSRLFRTLPESVSRHRCMEPAWTSPNS